MCFLFLLLLHIVSVITRTVWLYLYYSPLMIFMRRHFLSLAAYYSEWAELHLLLLLRLLGTGMSQSSISRSAENVTDALCQFAVKQCMVTGRKGNV